jgi:hypothetical protein
MKAAEPKESIGYELQNLVACAKMASAHIGANLREMDEERLRGALETLTGQLERAERLTHKLDI